VKNRDRLSRIATCPFRRVKAAAFSDDNQPSRMQIRNAVNRANNYNLTAHVAGHRAIVILTPAPRALLSEPSERPVFPPVDHLSTRS